MSNSKLDTYKGHAVRQHTFDKETAPKPEWVGWHYCTVDEKMFPDWEGEYFCTRIYKNSIDALTEAEQWIDGGCKYEKLAG